MAGKIPQGSTLRLYDLRPGQHIRVANADGTVVEDVVLSAQTLDGSPVQDAKYELVLAPASVQVPNVGGGKEK